MFFNRNTVLFELHVDESKRKSAEVSRLVVEQGQDRLALRNKPAKYKMIKSLQCSAM